MAAPLRCLVAAGLGVLALAGTLSPSVASAAPTPEPTTSSAPSATPGSDPSRSVTYQRDPGDFSLTVSPTRLAIGQQQIGSTQRITLVNRGEAVLAVTAEKRNFTVGKDGSLRYQDDAPYAASSWVTVSPKQMEIEPGADQVVDVTIRAPDVYEPGDHQVALVFMVPAGASEGNIKVNRGIGLPVYITAPGPVSDRVSLSDLTAPGFVTGGPVDITATITNTGTVHHDFRTPSPLSVEVAGDAAPFSDFTVPRDSVRDVKTTWDPPFLCVCHPTVTLTSAEGGVQTETVRVIVFPWPWFAAGAGLVALLVLGVRLSRRRYAAQVAAAAAKLGPPVPRTDG